MEGGGMEDIMTSKEFDLMIALILSMLEKGETDEVIKLLREVLTKKKSDDED